MFPISQFLYRFSNLAPPPPQAWKYFSAQGFSAQVIAPPPLSSIIGCFYSIASELSAVKERHALSYTKALNKLVTVGEKCTVCHFGYGVLSPSSMMMMLTFGQKLKKRCNTLCNAINWNESKLEYFCKDDDDVCTFLNLCESSFSCASFYVPSSDSFFLLLQPSHAKIILLLSSNNSYCESKCCFHMQFATCLLANCIKQRVYFQISLEIKYTASPMFSTTAYKQMLSLRFHK